jgi:hypothetical protein
MVISKTGIAGDLAIVSARCKAERVGRPLMTALRRESIRPASFRPSSRPDKHGSTLSSR